MTETEWLACDDSGPMLEFVRDKVSNRKLWLFAAASFWRLADLLPDPRQQQAIEVLELLAEGTITRSECRGVASDARLAAGEHRFDDNRHFTGIMLYREHCSSSIGDHAITAAAGREDHPERREQARLMRCIVGNPFRPVGPIGPAILSWNAGTIQSLARTIYDKRAIDRMPLLADALEDAGCTDAELLGHLRSPGPHVHGCWAVDLLSGRD
jgi:hypothetical protein